MEQEEQFQVKPAGGSLGLTLQGPRGVGCGPCQWVEPLPSTPAGNSLQVLQLEAQCTLQWGQVPQMNLSFATAWKNVPQGPCTKGVAPG